MYLQLKQHKDAPKKKEDAPKKKEDAPKKKDDVSKTPSVTLKTVEETFGPLTKEIGVKVFSAYESPLAGNESELISAFQGQGLSAWIGLAIIAQESSFANQSNNPDVDERNKANPFSVHFTSPKKFKGCGKNALLIAAPGENYTPSDKVGQKCAAADHRLPTFAESAKAAAKIVKEKGFAAYREEPGYEKDLDQRLNDILRRIKLAPK